MRRLLIIPLLMTLVALAGCDRAALVRFARLRAGEPERFRAVVLRPDGATPAGLGDEVLARRIASELALVLNVAPGVRRAPAPLDPPEVRRLGVLLGTEVVIEPTWLIVEPGAPARLRVRVFNVYTGNPVAHVVLSGRSLDPARPDDVLKELVGELAPVMRRARDLGLAYMPQSSVMVAVARASTTAPVASDIVQLDPCDPARVAVAEGRVSTMNGSILPRHAERPMVIAADRRHGKHRHHKHVVAKPAAQVVAIQPLPPPAPRKRKTRRTPPAPTPEPSQGGTSQHLPIEPLPEPSRVVLPPPPDPTPSVEPLPTPEPTPTPLPPTPPPTPEPTPSVASLPAPEPTPAPPTLRPSPPPSASPSPLPQFNASQPIEPSPEPVEPVEVSPRLPPSPSPTPDALRESARLHLVTAERYLRMDRPEDAEAALRQALAIDPSFHEASRALEALQRDYPAIAR